jgi:GNAT superfamily N-acetyltransferase
MNLDEKRQALRHLLNENSPADALASYYAFYHPDNRTSLVIEPEDGRRADGYVALSNTGIDLFRPLITFRLPGDHPTAAAALVYRAVAPGAAVILSSPIAYEPLIRAFFTIDKEEILRIYVLDPDRFEPVINVLVTPAPSGNNLPRYVILQPHDNEGGGGVVAAAGLNWQSTHFAEIAVNTRPQYRRRGWGRSVVSALVQHLLAEGRLPIYVVAENNEASLLLAGQLGFIDTGVREIMIEGVLREQPAPA